MVEVGAAEDTFSSDATWPEASRSEASWPQATGPTAGAAWPDGAGGLDSLEFAALRAVFDGLWSALGRAAAAQDLAAGDPRIAHAPVASLAGGPGDDLIAGALLDPAAAYFLRGAEGADSLAGAELADDINGNQGDDAVSGGGGDDRLLGGQGQDLVDGGAGADLMNGNLGADTLDGGEGADTVRGGQADDLVAGGGGADELFGDAGSDTFRGGAGADLVHVGLHEGRDVVDDFNPAEGDRIRVDGIAEYSAEQAGADVRITLLHGSEVAPTVSEVIVRNASLATLSDGWISGG